MFHKLGSPFRAKNSPGVAGLLDEKAKVFYHLVNGSLNLGRIGDLIVSQVRGQAMFNDGFLDEVRFRILLILGVFLGEGNGSRDPERPMFSEPVLLECGIDKERLALSMSFGISSNEAQVFQSDLKGTRVASLAHLARTIGDGVVIRINRQMRKMELVVFVSRQMSESLDSGQSYSDYEWIEVSPQTEGEAPAVETYVELGDLDPPRFETQSVGTAEGVDQGDETTVVSGEEDEEEPEEQGGISGFFSKMGLGGKKKASGTKKKQRSREEVQKIQGNGQEEFSNEVWEVKKITQERDELLKRIKELESSPRTAPAPVTATVQTPEELKTPQAESLEKEIEDEAVLEAISKEDLEREAREIEERLSRPVQTSVVTQTKERLEDLELEFDHGRFSKRIERAKEEYVSIEGEIKEDRAKAWVDGLMKDLAAEKSRIQDLVTSLSATVRQKEHEFNTAEARLLEEVRQRDTALKQKTVALSRAKDQISQISKKLEDARQKGTSAKEEGVLKTKLDMAQKLLAEARKENSAWAQKAEDLKSQAAKLKNPNSNPEFVEMRSKLERAQRQLEELKRVNQQLAERAGGGNGAGDGKARSTSVQTLEEMKKKVDQSARQTTKLQTQNEQLQIKLEEHQKEEARLKKENFMLQAELRRLAAANKSSGGGKPSAA